MVLLIGILQVVLLHVAFACLWGVSHWDTKCMTTEDKNKILQRRLPAPCHQIDMVAWLNFTLNGHFLFVLFVYFIYSTAFLMLWLMLFYTACVAPPSCHALVIFDCSTFFFSNFLVHALSHSSRKSRRQSHFQVPLHAQHCRDQNEDFCDLQEHIPVLEQQAENTAYQVQQQNNTESIVHTIMVEEIEFISPKSHTDWL